jgi:hypothetical protein
LALDIEYQGLRRIQFHIERRRPATLVIVPEVPVHRAQVLAIPHSEMPPISTALAIVGEQLAGLD